MSTIQLPDCSDIGDDIAEREARIRDKATADARAFAKQHGTSALHYFPDEQPNPRMPQDQRWYRQAWDAAVQYIKRDYGQGVG